MFLTKNKEITQTRLANYVFNLERNITGEVIGNIRVPGGGERGRIPWRLKHYFDNDLENYPLLEGDLINIRTEQDFTHEDPKPSFFYLSDRVGSVLNKLFQYIKHAC